MKHTPGPWVEVELNKAVSVIRAANGATIADFHATSNIDSGLFPTKEEQQGNVALFLAAPDMLETLKDKILWLREKLLDATGSTVCMPAWEIHGMIQEMNESVGIAEGHCIPIPGGKPQ